MHESNARFHATVEVPGHTVPTTKAFLFWSFYFCELPGPRWDPDTYVRGPQGRGEITSESDPSTCPVTLASHPSQAFCDRQRDWRIAGLGGILRKRLRLQGYGACSAVAQLGERLVRNEEVRGSTPLGSTNSGVRL
jgi:hypothetical protein